VSSSRSAWSALPSHPAAVSTASESLRLARSALGATTPTALVWVGGLAMLSVLSRRPRPRRIDRIVADAAAGLPHGRGSVAVGRAVTVAGAPSAALAAAVTVMVLLSRRCAVGGGAGARGDPYAFPPAREGPEGQAPRWGVLGWAAVIVTGLGARRVLSRVIRRARPPQSRWWVTPRGYGFPSKHATASALAALALLRSGRGRGRQGISAVGLAVAGAVGVSRVYLGVHWASDVLGGWLFAGAWTAVAGILQDRSFATDRPQEQSHPGGRT
jgi:membrane-associated phospholipid phosphatase